MELQLHDRVKMKKPHPCGCAIFEVTRLGVDYKLKCTGCGHQIMVARRLVEKNTKGLKKKDGMYEPHFLFSVPQP